MLLRPVLARWGQMVGFGGKYYPVLFAVYRFLSVTSGLNCAGFFDFGYHLHRLP
jgi:hypothetical protein